MTFFHMPNEDRRLPELLVDRDPDADRAVGKAVEEVGLRDLYLLRTVVDFVAISLADRPFEDLLAKYLEIVRPLGFAHVGMVDMAGAVPSPTAGLCFTTFPVEMVTRFTKSSRWLDDPVWKAAVKAEDVVRWSRIEGCDDGPTAGMDVFYRTEGLTDGLLVPVSTQRPERAVIFLAADRPLDLDDTIEEMLKVASRVLADRASRFRKWDDAPQCLTRRERQVLTQTAFGKSAREIGIDLDMSEKTVARHLLNIRGKLGAANTVQAVVMALRQNQIQI